MTRPKSLGPSLQAQPEPWESVVNRGGVSIDCHLLRWFAVSTSRDKLWTGRH